MVSLDGIQYLFTVPAGIAVGLLVSLLLSLIGGPTWWLIAPPMVGFFVGKWAGDRL